MARLNSILKSYPIGMDGGYLEEAALLSDEGYDIVAMVNTGSDLLIAYHLSDRARHADICDAMMTGILRGNLGDKEDA